MKFRKFQRILIIFLIAIGFFYGGYYFGKRGFVFEVRKNPPEIEISNKFPPDGKLDFSLFWEVWDILNSTYLERPIDQKKMIYGAISGMVYSLGDPYTSFLPPDINASFMDSMGGRYEGIGAELSLKDGNLIIVSPLDGSPAKNIGVKPGDRILQIDDKSTAGMSVSEAVALIRGESGTTVKLVLQTGTDDPREVVITRGVITVSSVTWEDKGDGTAYIRISRFGSDTNTEWDRVASEVNVKMSELDAVIIDVRGNPGGYLESAIHISEDFFRGKPVLYEETSTGELIPFNTSKVGVFKDIPAVFVLIDQGSASASEILAAALRDNIGAKLIGEKSFGKGTIQDARDFNDGSGLHITIAKWLTPKKEWVHGKGLEPDITVKITDEDLDKGVDPQLNKALELAKEF
ncbi:MAG TPA: S41 family peptidase [bacterium]|jgi:carboxyl-terminal processing protease|nr:S41 family peptidase [bacterium]HOV97464.1 S41 family peptidase [bacterium]HQG58577.1 S41 family peptidase [bacterium]HQK41592.1 S41 family peptidase [bacterium]